MPGGDPVTGVEPERVSEWDRWPHKPPPARPPCGSPVTPICLLFEAPVWGAFELLARMNENSPLSCKMTVLA